MWLYLAIAINCLKTQPTWMDDLPAVVKSLELNKLFLPGTHDSGAYDDFKPRNILNKYLKYVFTQVSIKEFVFFINRVIFFHDSVI